MTQATETEPGAGGEGRLPAGHEYKVIVNGREKPVDHRVLTFDEVVQLAFDPVPTGPDVTFTVTYSHAVKPQHEGIVSPGGEVTIKQGTIFDVTRTDKS